MTSELTITLVAIVAAFGLACWMVILERRGTARGQLPAAPTTPILFIAVMVMLLAAAHLMTILTGSPHLGRLR